MGGDDVFENGTHGIAKAQDVNPEVSKVEWMRLRTERQKLRKLAQEWGSGIQSAESAGQCSLELGRRCGGIRGQSIRPRRAVICAARLPGRAGEISRA